MRRPIHILLLLSIPALLLGQQDTLEAANRASGSVILTNVLSFIPSAFLVMSIHEMGHVSFAKLFGANNARWGIYRRTPEGGTQYGWADADLTNLSRAEVAFVHIGGVLFSRGLSQVSDCLASTIQKPFWLQQFFSMTFLMSRIDLPRYILQDALLNLFDYRGSDIDEFVATIAGRSTTHRTLTYTALLTVAVIDLALDWPRIRKHWAVLRGQPYGRSAAPLRVEVSVSPYIATYSFGMNATIKW